MKPEKNNEAVALRLRAEQRLSGRAQAAGAPAAAVDAQRLLQELQIHQVELEMQNEELREAKAQTEAAAARYADLYNFAPAGYFTLGRDGAIAQANLEGARLLDCERGGLTGKRFGAFLAAAGLPEFNAFLERVFAAAPAQTCEVETAGRGDAARTLRLEAALCAEGGTCRVVAADITRQKACERDLEKLNAGLLAKNREFEDFLFITSHDLRSPLVNVVGFLGYLSRHCAEARALQAAPAADGGGRLKELLGSIMPEELDCISASAARMDSLISGLLRMARLGTLELKPEPVDMESLVDGILKTMAFRLNEAGAEVKTGKLPPCTADKDRLTLVFSNLLDNALKYRDPLRKLVITISGEIAESGAVSYTVEDNGRGLNAEEAREKIWKPFYRCKPRGAVPGEGVGLTISKRIMEKHGGVIKALPAPGGGTVFTVELPFKGGK
ncbi:MAG TPA: HAMP domain-containing sensor histidine kinase [Elusimicrobiales bacterium]|mgnify:CR=1 FL=1|nr:HAMP domain-containing sensor histidine kinase [Elusimicrobiales bacterium]